MKKYILEVDNGKLLLPKEVTKKLKNSNLVLVGMGDHIEIKTNANDLMNEEFINTGKKILQLIRESPSDIPHQAGNLSDIRTDLSLSQEERTEHQSLSHKTENRILFIGSYDIKLKGNILNLPDRYAALFKTGSNAILKAYNEHSELVLKLKP